MYPSSPEASRGGVGVTAHDQVVAALTPKRPRGRPRKVVAPPVNPLTPDKPALVEELLVLVRELSAQQQRVLEQVVASQTATTDMMKTWLQMFLPAPTPLASTTEETRAKLREERELTEWEPMPEQLLHDVLRTMP